VLTPRFRPVKQATQRLIVFIASPITNEVEELVQVAKKLKKMQVNVDIVNFGETSANTSKVFSSLFFLHL
jgi:26S proteasome regulatory subunit N10